jgi:hypothetical protein
VSEYKARGKYVEVPELSCPGCKARLRPWSRYQRWVRVEWGDFLIWVKRVCCPAPTERCQRTHALLPEFVVERRRDEADTIGRAIEMEATGTGPWKTASALKLPYSTVWGWHRRLRDRYAELIALLAREGLRVGGVVGELPREPAAAMVSLLETVWERSRARTPGVPGRWRFWNLACSGRGLAHNTSPAC